MNQLMYMYFTCNVHSQLQLPNNSTYTHTQIKWRESIITLIMNATTDLLAISNSTLLYSGVTNCLTYCNPIQDKLVQNCITTTTVKHCV